MSDKPSLIPVSVVKTAVNILDDIETFSDVVIGLKLHPYQVDCLRPIIHSILNREGMEYLLVFPRQAGKNEAVAQLMVYLMVLFSRTGGNIVFAAQGDGLSRGARRLNERLENKWTKGAWHKERSPMQSVLGNAAAVFLSSYPHASTRGETAHWAVFVDEVQDQLASHIEAVFTPMRASTNACAIYFGTVKTSHDYLWQKKRELEALTEKDGRQRVFMVMPEEVIKYNPAYGHHLRGQIAKHGRNHPIIASEYYLTPIDAAGGLFDARRQSMMHGDYHRAYTPNAKDIYIATLDVAGQDEGATNPVAQLENPGRDYTVCTIFRYIPAANRNAPMYHAVDVFVDHGTKHFEQHPNRDSLSEQLLNFINHWRISHVISDATGVGEGLTNWLSLKLGNNRVTPFKFTTKAIKAALGSSFLAMIETNRFKYWTGDETTVGSDGWWFWQQVTHCAYDMPPDGRFDRDLKWHVPASVRVDIPGKGLVPVHDDRLISAALIAHADTLIAEGKLLLGRAYSQVIAPVDSVV